MLTDYRPFYRPFEYSFAEDYTRQQQLGIWDISRITLTTDLIDWNEKLTISEKNLIGNILKGFTQAEILVGDYWRQVAEWFPKPEISGLATSMSFFEVIHQQAYDLLNSTLGLNNYEAFIQDEDIKNKLELLMSVEVDNTNGKYKPLDILKSLSIFSAFTEGVSIFSSFAILRSFKTRSLLKGVVNIIDYSVRDESLHSHAGISLYNQYYKELVDNKLITKSDIKELEQSIVDAAYLVFELESKFIDKCFELGAIDCIDDNYKSFKLTANHIKVFIYERILSKLVELNMEKNIKQFNKLVFNNSYFKKDIELIDILKTDLYDVYIRQMSWFNSNELRDFFDTKSTEYTKYQIDESIDI